MVLLPKRPGYHPEYPLPPLPLKVPLVGGMVLVALLYRAVSEVAAVFPDMTDSSCSISVSSSTSIISYDGEGLFMADAGHTKVHLVDF